jgi:hypothetical protein
MLDGSARSSGNTPLRCGGGIARVRGACGLDEQEVGLILRAWAVLNALRHDEELTWPEGDISVLHLNSDSALQDKEEVVGIRMCVPYEITLDLTTMRSCPLN